MIDTIYKLIQALLNKDQLGYLKPEKFNLYAINASRKVYNEYFIDLKSNVRKMNWMLDGKNFANLAEHTQQLIEHFSEFQPIASNNTPTGTEPRYFTFPSDMEFVEDVFIKGTAKDISKVDFNQFKGLQRNIYASPSLSSPLCAKVNVNLHVLPNTISDIDLHYLRKPKYPKWTFVEDSDGKPLFDPTATDYQDFDLPHTSQDALVSYIAEQAGVTIRDAVVIQSANQEQGQDIQLDNKQ